jgi:hypothetical protein
MNITGNITGAVLREPGGRFTLERLELAGPRDLYAITERTQ